jgi:excinuclease UvrABC nuclease subunit
MRSESPSHFNYGAMGLPKFPSGIYKTKSATGERQLIIGKANNIKSTLGQYLRWTTVGMKVDQCERHVKFLKT